MKSILFMTHLNKVNVQNFLKLQICLYLFMILKEHFKLMFSFIVFFCVCHGSKMLSLNHTFNHIYTDFFKNREGIISQNLF